MVWAGVSSRNSFAHSWENGPRSLNTNWASESGEGGLAEADWPPAAPLFFLPTSKALGRSSYQTSKALGRSSYQHFGSHHPASQDRHGMGGRQEGREGRKRGKRDRQRASASMCVLPSTPSVISPSTTPLPAPKHILPVYRDTVLKNRCLS